MPAASIGGFRASPRQGNSNSNPLRSMNPNYDQARNSPSFASSESRPAPEQQYSIASLDQLVQEASSEPLALQYMQQSLLLRQQLFSQGPEVSEKAQEFCIRCNLLAMRFLKEENYVLSLEYLKKAEWCVTNRERPFIVQRPLLKLQLLGATWNNFGCFFKRRGKLRLALQYMEKALKVELKLQQKQQMIVAREAKTKTSPTASASNLSQVPQLGDSRAGAPSFEQEPIENSILRDAQKITSESPSTTHLNICAVLSQMGRHKKALKHAKDALKCLIEEEKRRQQLYQDNKQLYEEWYRNRDPSMKAVTYHNLAVEYEFLANTSKTRKYYTDAVLEARKTLGIAHPTTAAIEASYSNALGEDPPNFGELYGMNRAITHREPKKRHSVAQDVRMIRKRRNQAVSGRPRRRASQFSQSTAPTSGFTARRRNTYAHTSEVYQKRPSLRENTTTTTTTSTLPSIVSSRKRNGTGKGNLSPKKKRTTRAWSSSGSRRRRSSLRTDPFSTRADILAQVNTDYQPPIGNSLEEVPSNGMVPVPPSSSNHSHGNQEARRIRRRRERDSLSAGRSRTPTLTEREFSDENLLENSHGRKPKENKKAPAYGAPKTPIRKHLHSAKRKSTSSKSKSKQSSTPRIRNQKKSKASQDKQAPLDYNTAAVNIQRTFRGHMSRKHLRQEMAIKNSYGPVRNMSRFGTRSTSSANVDRPPVHPLRNIPPHNMSKSQASDNGVDELSDEDNGGGTTPPAVFNHLMNISATLDNLKQSLSVENSFAMDEELEDLGDVLDEEMSTTEKEEGSKVADTSALNLVEPDAEFENESFNEDFSLEDDTMNAFEDFDGLDKQNPMDDLEDLDGDLSSIDGIGDADTKLEL